MDGVSPTHAQKKFFFKQLSFKFLELSVTMATDRSMTDCIYYLQGTCTKVSNYIYILYS